MSLPKSGYYAVQASTPRKWLKVQSDGKLAATEDTQQTASPLLLEPLDVSAVHPTFALKFHAPGASGRGVWLSRVLIGSNNYIIAVKEEIDPFCHFAYYEIDGNLCGVAADTGLFWHVDTNDRSAVKADASSYLTDKTCQFSLFALPDQPDRS
jgi:hypothetical protein